MAQQEIDWANIVSLSEVVNSDPVALFPGLAQACIDYKNKYFSSPSFGPLDEAFNACILHKTPFPATIIMDGK